MMDIQDRNYCPNLQEIDEYIKNPVFKQFCLEIKTKYKCNEKIEYSSCSYEKGQNIKFKKAGKTLCTIYPRKNYFTVMVVIGKKEKEQTQLILHELSYNIQKIYHNTREGNNQKWLMIDLNENDEVYKDILRLIDIRRNS